MMLIMVVGCVIIPSGEAKHLISDKVFTRTVAFNNCRHHILRHLGIVGKKLLGILRQAVASVAERGIVVVRTNTGIKTYSFNYSFRVKTFYFA